MVSLGSQVRRVAVLSTVAVALFSAGVHPIRAKNSTPIPEIIGGTVANSSQFKNVGALKEGTSKFCTGTLIAPNWVLTAAHCLEEVDPGQLSNFKFEVGGKNYAWKSIHIHPAYSWTVQHPRSDIALIRLSTSVTGITPATVRTTVPKVGEKMTIVGYGPTGSGWQGITGGEGIKRFGTVTIDRITFQLVLWNFTAPEPNNTAPGDSGGPGFSTTGAIISVCSGGLKADASWGDEAFNTRTDIFVKWINNTLAANQSANRVPLGIRALVEPRVAGELAVDALPDVPGVTTGVKSLFSERNLDAAY